MALSPQQMDNILKDLYPESGAGVSSHLQHLAYAIVGRCTYQKGSPE